MVRCLLLIGFLLSSCISHAQTGPFCIEKSSRNSYSAGNDTALNLYKAVSQTSTAKIVLFTIKKNGALNPTATLASIANDGDIKWTRALGVPPDYSIKQFDAIVLNNKNIFVFLITQQQGSNTDPVFHMKWFTENGNPLQEKSFNLKSTVSLGWSLDMVKLKETAGGELLFMIGSINSNSGGAIIGKMDNDGELSWNKTYAPTDGPYYTPVDLMSYDDIIILQGFATNGLHSTKLRVSDGTIISGKCFKIYTGGGGASLYSRAAVLTDDHKIKTLGSQRIYEHYEIYFSYTQDTALNMVQSTNYFTPTSFLSYLPSCVTLNNRGMTLIKGTGGIDVHNIGFFLADNKDSVLREWTINSDQSSGGSLSGGPDEVAFDDHDSLYVYWPAKKNGINTVGWIKTGFDQPTAFCVAKDSSYIQTLPIAMGTANWSFIEMNSAIFEPNSFTTTIFAPTIKKDLVCEKITGFCDPIKISPIDTVCSIAEPVVLTVKKNTECRGKILFSFSEPGIADWQQPDDTTLILHFDKSWKGKIYAGSSFCPLVKDSISLIVSAPLPGIDLGKDAILCKGDTLKLVAENGFKSYTWQNGSSTASFIITQGGTYHLTVKDNCNRSYSDTIKVILVDKKVDLGADRTICKKASATLTARGDVISYSWSPSYALTGDGLKDVTVHPETTTAYHIAAKTSEGCIAKDTVTIFVEECIQTFFIPSAFTPNNDGKNDLFKPIITAPLEQYEFSIYDRWGQRVFYSKDISKGWDGKIAGTEQDGGTFIWMCTLKFYDQLPVFKKGSFVLIR